MSDPMDAQRPPETAPPAEGPSAEEVPPAGPEPAPSTETLAPPPAAPARGRRSLLRWVIAGFLTVAVVGGAAAGYLALQSAGQKPSAAAFLPADTLVFTQVTADPSGDQRDRLPALLKKFPGFEDQSTLGQKVDESLTRLFARGEIDYVTEVKPWLGATVAVGLRWLEASQANEAQVALLVASTDDAKAQAFIDGRAAAAGAAGGSSVSETYRDVPITTIQRGGERTSLTLAVLDGQLIVARDAASAKLIVDTRSGVVGASPQPGGSLGDLKAFKDALAALPGDRVGTFYVDLRQILDRALALQGAGPGLEGLPELPQLSVEGEGALVGYLRVEEDGALFDFSVQGNLQVAAASPAAAPLTPPPGLGGDRESRLADAVPAGALLFVDIHDLGPAVRFGVDSAARQQPGLGETIDQVDQALVMLGTSVDELLGLFGDGAVVVSGEGATVGGGIVLEVTDPAGAGRLIDQLDVLVGFGGVGEVITEEYKGATLHQLELSGGQMPLEGLTLQPTYGLAGDLLVVALDPAFARAVVDVTAGADSLADDPAYQAVVRRLGEKNSGLVFVDVDGLLELAEGAGATIPEDVAPFLEPISAIGIATTGGGDPLKAHSRLFILIE